MSIQDLKELIYPVCETAIQAGKLIKKYYKSKINISLKDDNSPITQADLESNQLIKNSLVKIDNKIPILSEEALVDWSIRKNWQTYWLVDPLDGTKEFIKENDEFTVNIALIKDNRPVLGVIYAPALEVIYFAYKNGGSYKLSIDADKIIINYLDDSIKLQASSKKENESLRVIYSRSHPNDKMNTFLKQFKKYKIYPMGSSLKICRVSDGSVHLYPRLGPTMEWDTAAAHAVLKSAGGEMIKYGTGSPLRYNKQELLNPKFIAGNLSIISRLSTFI